MLDYAEMPLCDVGLERALLALVFADNENLDRLGKLKPDDLSDPILAAILGGAMDMREDERPANLVTLKARLEGIRIDESKTGLDVVRDLTVGGTLPATEDIASRLRGLAVRRRLSEYLRALADAIADESQGVAVLAADAIGQMNIYLADAVEVQNQEPSLYVAAQDFIAHLQSGDDPIEIPSGLADLDKHTGGWRRGQFAILAGRPSMGKSCLALSSMLRTAEKGFGVLFFSLEMTRDQVVARALTDYAYSDPIIQYSNLKPGWVSGLEVQRLYEVSERFKDMPIEIDTRNGLTVADIMVKARRVSETMKADGHPLALVVLDHMLKVRPSTRYAGQPVKELDEISEAMCVMAKSLNVAVLGLHQLNRQVEQRENPRPLLSDLRGSGTLEQDADTVLFCYRPAYQFERQMQEPDKRMEAEQAVETLKHDMELQIAKQRNGPTTSLEFWIDLSANVVRAKDWRH